MLGCRRLDAQANGARVAARGPERGAGRGILAAAGAAALVAQPAWAHDGTGFGGGFVAGALHPVSGLDHLLAMVAVGLWGAFLGRPLIHLLPMLFPGMMVVGGAFGIAGLVSVPVEVGIALSVLVLGLMILFAVRAPVAIAVALVGIFALFHGMAHGIELPAAADPVGYSAGFVLSTGVLHLAGIALGMLRATPKGTLLLRGIGGAISCAGLWFLMRAASA